MSIEALRIAISEVISPSVCRAEFYFLLNTKGAIVVKRADIAEEAQNELTRNFIDSISNSLLLDDDISLVDISSADDRTKAIYKYDIDDVPPQLTHLSAILERDDFELFDFSSDDLSNLEGILILLGHDARQLALYKHQYPISLLKRDSGFSLIRIRNQNRLVKLEDDILRINSKFEFIRIDGQYYIVDIKTLERFFGFHEAIKSIAIQGIANIARSGLVESTDVLTERLDDISFSRKLVKAARNSPVLGVIPNEQVIVFILTHPALRGKFTISDDGARLQLKTKVSQNLFLKLLNDDFLQSDLTKRYYASLAKDNINTSA